MTEETTEVDDEGCEQDQSAEPRETDDDCGIKSSSRIYRVTSFLRRSGNMHQRYCGSNRQDARHAYHANPRGATTTDDVQRTIIEIFEDGDTDNPEDDNRTVYGKLNFDE